jgi:recombination protein RecA
MSSLPCHAADAVPLFPARFPDFDEKRASLLKHVARSEQLAQVQPASRLEVRPRREMFSTGIPEIDTITGGIPRGCLSEIYGAASSGKTSMVVAAIAAATRRDESCVLVDASDSFDPTSGQAAGIDLGRLLWVRCGGSSCVVRRSSSAYRKTDDRESNHSSTNDQRLTAHDQHKHRLQKSSELRLEQVLKTTDLILQSGGFGLVALDLARIPEKFVRRIPLASWFRFQRAVEHTKTALLVVSEFPCAQTCAALVVKVCTQPSAIGHEPSGKPAHAEVFEATRVQAEIVRTRLERKPMQSVKTSFATQAVRAG